LGKDKFSIIWLLATPKISFHAGYAQLVEKERAASRRKQEEKGFFIPVSGFAQTNFASQLA
jgi:hypothetical protein